MYFQAAIDGLPPADRSFVYPWLVKITALAAGDARALVAAQALLGWLVACGLYAGLRVFGVRRTLAFAAAALLALEPAQLYYERMLMAETAGLAALLAMFGCACAYVQRGGAAWIVAYVLCGVAAVSLRLGFLPVVLAMGAVPPLVRWLAAGPRDARAGSIVALHLALSLTATWGAHVAYRQAYGALSHGPPAYTASAGRFRLAVLAPLVEPEHFAGTGVDPSVLAAVGIDRRDPRQREAQLWMSGGLVDVVSRHAADPERVASVIASRALRDRPWRLFRVAWSMLQDHLDGAVAARHLATDLGPRRANSRLAADMQARLAMDANAQQAQITPSARWFSLGAPWLVACLLALVPLAAWQAWCGRRSPQFAARLLLALFSFGLVASHLLFSPLPSFRYLHPLPWFVLANVALLAQAFLRERGAQPQAQGSRGVAANTQKRELR